MKIYTKTGDKGETSLLGGTRVPKYHLRIEAYGTVDELNSWIGLIRDQAIDDHAIRVLVDIQERLFIIGAILASDPAKGKVKIPHLVEEDIIELEEEMDKMELNLPELRSFILPGGNTVVSFTHIARCVCRRCERLVVHLAEEHPLDEKVGIFLNRLSDYLFVLSRHLAQSLNAAESPWNPRT